MLDSNAGPDKDEAGWKLVTGDVFRSPSGSKTLAVQVRAAQRLGGDGSGKQRGRL